MLLLKKKAFAYITHGERLLVFCHPDIPEAGIQVPAGTIEERELPEAAVMREAYEETGLTNLSFHCLLGESTRAMADFGKNELHHRYFYHLYCHGEVLETWRHYERHPSAASKQALHLFEFFWARLPDAVPALIADHGKMLPELIKLLGL